MDEQRNWTRWALIACAAVVLMGASIASLPNGDDAACWRSTGLASEAWNSADSELAALQQRLRSRQHGTTDEDEANRMSSLWELWADARQASSVAASPSERSPDAALANARAALESCWLARDNTESVPVESGLPGRTYRPGSLVVRACEEAAALSEGAWQNCRHKALQGYQMSLLGGRSDYTFFGGGCFGF